MVVALLKGNLILAWPYLHLQLNLEASKHPPFEDECFKHRGSIVETNVRFLKWNTLKMQSKFKWQYLQRHIYCSESQFRSDYSVNG